MSNHNEGKRTLAFVIYPGLTVFDLVGPLQTLTRFTRFAPQYETSVVAESIEPVESDDGLKFLPDKSFAEVPHPYALIVPGGGIPTLKAMSSPAIRKYVLTAAETAEAVVSVCTGALILASVGLLGGKQVPTHWAFAKYLESFGAQYVRKRWVEDGKFLVTAGVSAGIDGALALVTRLSDPETARLVQLSIEYDPQPPGEMDYSYRDNLTRVLTTGIALMRPFYTAEPRRLIKRGI
ncbi:MAG TPA: DJ-1/PfpI family protein [Anaerolineales bacterium]